jgi:hypothetical protein
METRKRTGTNKRTHRDWRWNRPLPPRRCGQEAQGSPRTSARSHSLVNEGGGDGVTWQQHLLCLLAAVSVTLAGPRAV